ncbi:hypothetical protein, partial [Stenotrophomonas maltophilia]|uniref:hypothetical protein n=1 Tax=Stenotrophomonas maltophilia TaxID=40324 RepID=UPI00301A5CBD
WQSRFRAEEWICGEGEEAGRPASAHRSIATGGCHAPDIYYGVGHGPDAQLWILYALIAALMLFASWLTYRFFF